MGTAVDGRCERANRSDVFQNRNDTRNYPSNTVTAGLAILTRSSTTSSSSRPPRADAIRAVILILFSSAAQQGARPQWADPVS